MTDFEMDKLYKITGRELLALLSLIPDGDEKAKAILDNVAGREKSEKVNESQIDFLKPCPFCGGKPIRITNMWDSVVYPDLDPEYYVMCQSCDHEVRSDISMEDAEEEWNRRVSK